MALSEGLHPQLHGSHRGPGRQRTLSEDAPRQVVFREGRRYMVLELMGDGVRPDQLPTPSGLMTPATAVMRAGEVGYGILWAGDRA